MITHNLVQGSSAWHAHRATHDNASDAPAMMGCSSYKTRDQLIAELATGITPEVVFADADLGGGDGFKFKAKYSRADDRVTLTGEAAGQAEQIVLHELIHAATLKALDKPGLHSLQMRRLYEHVKRKGFGAGQYGMKNVGEFVAEAFTNPEFQRLLRQMDAASGRHAEIGLGWLCAHPALD